MVLLLRFFRPRGLLYATRTRKLSTNAVLAAESLLLSGGHKGQQYSDTLVINVRWREMDALAHVNNASGAQRGAAKTEVSATPRFISARAAAAAPSVIYGPFSHLRPLQSFTAPSVTYGLRVL